MTSDVSYVIIIIIRRTIMSKISARTICPLCRADVAEYKLKSHIGTRRCTMNMNKGKGSAKSDVDWKRMANRVPAVSDYFFGG